MSAQKGKFDPRIISKPGAQPTLHRSFFGVVTAAFWALYLYLWLPLLTLILWLLGVRTTIFELYLREHQVDPFLVLALPAMAAIAAAVLILWAEYNRWRFKGKERRSAQANIGLDRVAAALHATPEIATALNAGRISVLHMDQERAYPLSVTAIAPTAPVTPALPPTPPAESRTLVPAPKPGHWLVLVGLLLIAAAIAALVLISHTYTDPGLRRPVPMGTSAFDEATRQLRTAMIEPPPALPVPAPSAVQPQAPAKAPATAQKQAAAKKEARKPRKEKSARATNATATPIPGQSPKPEYPRASLRGGEGGLVVLRVTVAANGSPTRIDFARRSRIGALDRAARDAVMRWRFNPAMREGKPVASTVLVPVEFKPER
ncbi:poly-beta-1,6-N-acetyl-D-glucosamine biosynthesis protein PgaD [Luteimonas aquatica]|uniref:poly-beta-1,6-N-acetyl-D-glucosamine biosynthesis protein PgaD n=1 Tax=Luteimonas aquatica TaxID=450364 RepID=UPI001F57F331|nr:poly-beta-1,6-N-acetyl-D-glucosamine biosynthesis protein PgaD [Luteimonas aquatica]